MGGIEVSIPLARRLSAQSGSVAPIAKNHTRAIVIDGCDGTEHAANGSKGYFVAVRKGFSSV